MKHETEAIIDSNRHTKVINRCEFIKAFTVRENQKGTPLFWVVVRSNTILECLDDQGFSSQILDHAG